MRYSPKTIKLIVEKTGNKLFNISLSNSIWIYLWGTIPSMGNVAQPPLGKASGERGWRAGPTSMDRFSSGKSGLHCTYAAVRLALAETPSP